MTEEDYKVAEVILTSWVACESLAEVEEASSIYFVAGYCAYSLKKNNYHHCKDSLIKDNSPPKPLTDGDSEMDKEKEAEVQKFVSIMSRGGLLTPSDQLYITCLYVYSCFEHINNTPEEKESLMLLTNPRASFVATSCERIQESVETVSILNSTCDSGHKWIDILPKVALKMFHIMGKKSHCWHE